MSSTFFFIHFNYLFYRQRAFCKGTFVCLITWFIPLNIITVWKLSTRSQFVVSRFVLLNCVLENFQWKSRTSAPRSLALFDPIPAKTRHRHRVALRNENRNYFLVINSLSPIYRADSGFSIKIYIFWI